MMASVETESLSLLDKFLVFVHSCIEIPQLSECVQKRLFKHLESCLRDVVCGFQVGKKTLIHVYGRQSCVSAARMVIYKAVNFLLHRNCINVEGYFSNKRLGISGLRLICIYSLYTVSFCIQVYTRWWVQVYNK